MLWLIKNIPKILSRMLNILKYSGNIIFKLYQKICYFTYSFCVNRSVFFSVTSVIAFILGIGVFVAAIVWAFQYLNRKYPASAGNKVLPPDAKNGQTQQQGLGAGQPQNPADLLAQLAQNSQSAKQTPENNANITTPVENPVNNQNNNNNNSNNNNVSSTPPPDIANTINPINNLNNNSNNNNINPITNPVNNALNNTIPIQPSTSLSAKNQKGNASNSPIKINNPSLNGLGDLSSLFNKTKKQTNNIPSNSGQSINNLDSLNNNNVKSSPNG